MQSSFNLKSFQGEGAVRRPLRHSLFFALSLAASGKRTFSAPLTFWHRFRYHIVCDTTIYLLRFHSIPHVLRNTSPRRKPFFSTFMGGWLSLLLGGWCCTSKERVCRHETVRFALFRLWEKKEKGTSLFYGSNYVSSLGRSLLVKWALVQLLWSVKYNFSSHIFVFLWSR